MTILLASLFDNFGIMICRETSFENYEVHLTIKI